jgi:putative FmdB family regulatory protein
MPLYDYCCATCGTFTEMRPMAEYDQPAACPECGADSPRAFITAPRLAMMSSERRVAFATNERSAHAPRSSGDFTAERAGKKKHGSGCSCCSGASSGKGKAVRTADGSKVFPSKRPWMISH